MKNSIKAYISAVALAAASMSVLLVTESATGDAPRAFGTVINPDIPQKMTLCGKTVDLDRTDMWERLDRELTSMAYTHGNTMLILKRANKLFPRMAPILKNQGVPEDLRYRACIESNLDQRAYSSAKAAGIWQFIPSTATQFGLEVSD